jgi:hypothetical protein
VVGQVTLGRLEECIDASEAAPTIEGLLPVGVRSRQLSVRSLLCGLLAAQADGRPAHLTWAHRALVTLPDEDRWRLGVLSHWKTGPHLLTYRQMERTFSLVVTALAKDEPDGAPSTGLSMLMDALIEASIPDAWKDRSHSLAVDWSDLESFSSPPPAKGGACADAEASWGRRKSDVPGARDELFFGYELQAATMVGEEQGPPVPELARRITLTSCHLDPPSAFVPVLERLVDSGIPLGDVLADSGYAHRKPERWALPVRLLGGSIVTDLHPSDRGPKGTFAGAIIANGTLFCPATPRTLLELGPLPRQVTTEEIATHDRQAAERPRYQLGRLSSDDADGYHRVACPAVAGKIRCPLRAASMTQPGDRPEILTPPEPAPKCCCQQTITVPVEATAKTAQKHDYPSAAHRLSYARRTAVERTFSTVKDRASNDMTKGWCRVMGLTAISLMLTAGFVVRNARIVDAFESRQADDARRAAQGLEPKTRRRRRKTISDLVGTRASP